MIISAKQQTNISLAQENCQNSQKIVKISWRVCTTAQVIIFVR